MVEKEVVLTPINFKNTTNRVVAVDSGIRKSHVAYDYQGRCFKIDNGGLATQLRHYDEIRFDVIFPQMYNDMLKLLQSGKRVRELTNKEVLKKFRQKHGLKKADDIDARILLMLPDSCFKDLTMKEFKMRILIGVYEDLEEEVQKLKNKCKNNNMLAPIYKEIVDMFDRKKDEVANMIHEAMKEDRFYNEVANYFGYKKCPLIAMLLVRVDFSRGMHKILDFLGLHGKVKYRYSRKARSLLSKISFNIYIRVKRGHDSLPQKYKTIVEKCEKRCKELAEKSSKKVTWNMLLNMTLIRIGTEIIRDIRKIWLRLNNESQLTQ